MRPDCGACCFFRIIKARDRQRRLCQLTGARRPMAGDADCCFIAGEWSQLDAILGLPKVEDCGNSGVPNQTRPGNGFSDTGRIVARENDLVDFSASRLIIQLQKQEGSLVRPGTREGQVARLARERTYRLPFNV